MNKHLQIIKGVGNKKRYWLDEINRPNLWWKNKSCLLFANVNVICKFIILDGYHKMKTIMFWVLDITKPITNIRIQKISMEYIVSNAYIQYNFRTPMVKYFHRQHAWLCHIY